MHAYTGKVVVLRAVCSRQQAKELNRLALSRMCSWHLALCWLVSLVRES